MHNYSELIKQSTSSTLRALDNLNLSLTQQNDGSTNLVKNLQIVTLQKSIIAVGIFSMFEAQLQNRLNCKKGFQMVKKS